jgi:hypothetical protein
VCTNRWFINRGGSLVRGETFYEHSLNSFFHSYVKSERFNSNIRKNLDGLNEFLRKKNCLYREGGTFKRKISG